MLTQNNEDMKISMKMSNANSIPCSIIKFIHNFKNHKLFG